MKSSKNKGSETHMVSCNTDKRKEEDAMQEIRAKVEPSLGNTTNMDVYYLNNEWRTAVVGLQMIKQTYKPCISGELLHLVE